MAMTFGFLQPAEKDGVTFSLAATTASAVQTATANAIIQITCATTGATPGANAFITVTFGSSGASNQLGNTGGHAPTTPSITNGYAINANTQPVIYWLGPNRDSFQVFNASAAAMEVSWQILMP